MLKLSACLSVGILALSACGDDGGKTTVSDAAIDQQQAIDAKVFEDAPPPTFDWSCETNTTPPTTTAADITLSGTVQAVTAGGGGLSIDAVDDAALTACVNDGTDCTVDDGTANSDTSGAWTIGPFTTGGTSQDDYIKMTASGMRDTYTYPDSPFVGNQSNIPVLTFDSTAEGLLSAVGGCNTSQAIVGLAVVDCMRTPITDTANVTITIKQGGTTVAGTTVLDASQFNSMAAGTFLVCGVPADATTEVSATYLGHQLLAHNVKTVAGDTTATILVPGY
jgi:hypothetical protein